VFTNLQFLSDVVFDHPMITQSIGIASSATAQYYVPNSAPNNGIDLRKPSLVVWDNEPGKRYRALVSESPDPSNPPHRVVQYSGNLGFQVGYVLTRGIGRSLADFTDQTFTMRGTSGKIYPFSPSSGKVGVLQTASDSYSVVMYRAYTDLSKTK